MDDTSRALGSGRWVAVEVVAAFTVGAFFAVRGLPLALLSGFADLARGFPVGAAAVAAALLAVVVTLAASLSRVPGWPLAAGGLLLAALADLLPGSDQWAVVLTVEAPSAGRLLVPLAAAAGTGLALCGALAAVTQVPRPARPPVAAGLAAGLVFHPLLTELTRTAATGPYSATGRSWHVQLAITLLAVVLAAVAAHRRAVPPGIAGLLRPGPVVAAGVAALVVLGGLALRWWVVEVFRAGPDGLAGPRRERAVEAFAHYSTLAIATVAALVLLGYAYRRAGVGAARWVLLGVAAGPVLVLGPRLDLVTPRPRSYLLLVAGVVALAAGAALARHAPRMLPWDALGLLLAAVALPLRSPVVRAELPSAAAVELLLTAIGLGLAFGFALAAASTALPGDGRDGSLAALLALGPAGLVLSALALAPVVARAQIDSPSRGPALTVPAFVAVAAVLLVLLFGFARAVERIRDLRVQGEAAPPPDGADVSRQ